MAEFPAFADSVAFLQVKIPQRKQGEQPVKKSGKRAAAPLIQNELGSQKAVRHKGRCDLPQQSAAHFYPRNL